MRAAILWLSGPLAFALIGGVIGGRLGINLGPGTDGRQFARRDRRNCRLHVSATLGDCGKRQRIKTLTVFAKKLMSVDDWAKVQDRIEDLPMALRAPHDLMMFSAEADDPLKETIYIGVPNAELLANFQGFQQVNRADLPDFLTTLVVREDGFAEQFPDIEKKRRARI